MAAAIQPNERVPRAADRFGTSAVVQGAVSGARHSGERARTAADSSVRACGRVPIKSRAAKAGSGRRARRGATRQSGGVEVGARKGSGKGSGPSLRAAQYEAEGAGDGLATGC